MGPRLIANFGTHGDGHSALHATERLQGFDHGVQTPGLHVLVEFLVEPLEALGVCSAPSDVCLEDDVLRRGRADDLREPPAMGWAPMGLAGVADSVAEHKSFAAKLGVLAVAEGLFTGPRQIPHGFIVHLGDIDRGEIPRASQAGQWHGVSAVGGDAVTGFLGNE
jgi:hypothetical protein